MLLVQGLIGPYLNLNSSLWPCAHAKNIEIIWFLSIWLEINICLPFLFVLSYRDNNLASASAKKLFLRFVWSYTSIKDQISIVENCRTYHHHTLLSCSSKKSSGLQLFSISFSAGLLFFSQQCTSNKLFLCCVSSLEILFLCAGKIDQFEHICHWNLDRPWLFHTYNYMWPMACVNKVKARFLEVTWEIIISISKRLLEVTWGLRHKLLQYSKVPHSNLPHPQHIPKIQTIVVGAVFYSGLCSSLKWFILSSSSSFFGPFPRAHILLCSIHMGRPSTPLICTFQPLEPYCHKNWKSC